MATTTQLKFHKGAIKRVLIAQPANTSTKLSFPQEEFIKNNFNKLRNYRGLYNSQQVDIITSIENLKDLKRSGACLLIGRGRIIDKSTYELAQTCFKNHIPVFFVRRNSTEVCTNIPDHIIWRTNFMVVKDQCDTKYYGCPSVYFMEIPSIEHIIALKNSNDFYALLPGFTP